jgi:hypothetical protein
MATYPMVQPIVNHFLRAPLSGRMVAPRLRAGDHPPPIAMAENSAGNHRQPARAALSAPGDGAAAALAADPTLAHIPRATASTVETLVTGAAPRPPGRAEDHVGDVRRARSGSAIGTDVHRTAWRFRRDARGIIAAGDDASPRAPADRRRAAALFQPQVHHRGQVHCYPATTVGQPCSTKRPHRSRSAPTSSGPRPR